jgi:hypothetical protein
LAIITSKSTYLLAAVSIATLGITITNIAQQALTFLFTQRNFKRLLTIFTLVMLIGICLNFISRSIYPVTDYFFIPQNLMEEQRYLRKSILNVGRVTKDFFIYNIAAPQPSLSIRNDMPRFNFLPGTIRNYSWFGWPAVILWVATLILALIYFLTHNYPAKYNGLLIAMLACLIFNFILHVGYGFEPFLYTPDWTYAIVVMITVVYKR